MKLAHVARHVQRILALGPGFVVPLPSLGSSFSAE